MVEYFNGCNQKPGKFLSKKEALSTGLIWFGLGVFTWGVFFFVFVLAGGLE